MRMRTGRFRSRVVRAIGVETKYSDFYYAPGPLGQYSTTSLLNTYPLSVVSAGSGFTNHTAVGTHVFLRRIEFSYLIRSGYLGTDFDSSPRKIRFALIRYEGPQATGPAPADIYGLSIALTTLDAALDITLPRQLESPLGTAGQLNVGPRNVKVLKQWVHQLGTWYPANGCYKIDQNRPEIVVRKSITINQDLKLGKAQTGTYDIWTPMYYLMVYTEGAQSFASFDFAPQFQIRCRVSYYDV